MLAALSIFGGEGRLGIENSFLFSNKGPVINFLSVCRRESRMRERKSMETTYLGFDEGKS